MNPKIAKVIADIERTKAKIAELQASLPELESRKIDLENTEIIRLVRSVNVAPENLSAFVEAYKSRTTQSQIAPSQTASTLNQMEDSDNE